jgi:hypothetical protein
MTLSPEDLQAIRTVVVDAVKDEFNVRTLIFTDALRVVDVKISEMHKVFVGEYRDNLAVISETRAAVGELQKLWDVAFQQTSIMRRSIAPNSEEWEAHELSKEASGYLEELRADEPPTNEEEEQSPHSRRR